jgi:hypothetical protein
VDFGLFILDKDGAFRLTPMGHKLRVGAEGSIRDAAIMYGEPWWWRAWGALYDAVRTGKPGFDAVHGIGFFDFLDTDPNAARLFNASMQLMTSAQASAVAASYDFSRTQRLVDVGGGEGALILAVLTRYPHVSAVLFDRESAIERGRERLSSFACEGRCEFKSGDFFTAIPEGADTYTLKDIIHDWPDEKALMILRNIRRVMRTPSRLLIVERILPGDNEPSSAKLIDVTMLALTGGRERTQVEYEVLLGRAGFVLRGVIRANEEIGVMECEPA